MTLSSVGSGLPSLESWRQRALLLPARNALLAVPAAQPRNEDPDKFNRAMAGHVHKILNSREYRNDQDRYRDVQGYMLRAPYCVTYITPKDWLFLRTLVGQMESECRDIMMDIVHNRPDNVRRNFLQSNKLFPEK